MKITPYPAVNEPGGAAFVLSFTRAELLEMKSSEDNFKKAFRQAIEQITFDVAGAVAAARK